MTTENYMALPDFQTLWDGKIKPWILQGNYVPTLAAAPTAQTTTYTKDGKTVGFELGQFARVADASADEGYVFFQLYDLVTSGGVTTAKWKEAIGSLTDYARKTDFNLAVLKQAVADGNLEKYGLKPGDQKTINGHTYVIAGLNPMKGPYAPYRVNTNHVGLIVIPHTTQAWNVSGNTSEGADGRGAGYLNSDLHYYLKNTVLPMCNTDLGADNLISHYKLLSSAVNTSGYNKFGEASGCSSSWTWENTKISALSEVQVYGAAIWSSSGYDTGEACRQLDVFQRYSHTEIFGGEYPWLRDVVSASIAADAYTYGNALRDAASSAIYVAALILFH